MGRNVSGNGASHKCDDEDNSGDKAPLPFEARLQKKRAAEEQQAELSCHWQPTDVDEVHRKADEAWGHLARGQCLADWLAVGASLAADRAEAMREAHTNQPRGPGYSAAFTRLLSRRPFANLEKTTRARLLQVMENLPAIQKWLDPLPLSQRMQINHPHTLLDRWKKATKVPDPDKPKRRSHVAEMEQSIAVMEQENHRLKKEIEIGGGDLWDPKDTAADIARIMVGKLSKSKADAVARAILKMLREKVGAAS